MKRFLCILFISTVLWSCGKTGYDVTLAGLLAEMTDGFSVCEYPATACRAMMTSSHDRRSVSPEEDSWYANDDGFGYEYMLDVDGREEKVLFDAEGPGAVMRIWITTLNPKSVLRFYFDGHQEPDWIVNSYDLTQFGLKALEDNPLLMPHTSYEKGVKGGQTLFLPIPYADGCRITLEEPAGWSGIPRYYNIEYRKYAEGVKVETFSVSVAKKYSTLVRQAGNSLKNGLHPKGKLSVGKEKLTLPHGKKAVTRLSVLVSGLDSANYESAMRKLVLKGVFDGKETINVPLGDFSGAGMGARAVDCRYLYADGKGLVESYWVMPYSETAEFEIVNVSGVECSVEMSALTQRYDFDAQTLYFHASWRAEEGLAVTNEQSECGFWDFATIKGRGVYVGDCLSLFNHTKSWYGEGDEKIYVDGESFPSFFGTGTEDYYNSSWAPVEIFHIPWGGAPRADLASSNGYNTFLRTRLGDVIPFSESLDFDLELISWTPGAVDYSSTIFWYGDRDAQAVGCTDPLTYRYELPAAPPDPRKYVVSNSIEAESLRPCFVSDGLNVSCQDMSAFPDGVWSGAKQMVFYGGKTGDRVLLRFENLQPGKYEVALYATKAADYGIASFRLNGGDAYLMDCWFPTVTSSGRVRIGEVDVADTLELEITIAGQNTSSKSNMLGLDCIILNKIS